MRLLPALLVGCLALPFCLPHQRASGGEAEEDAPPPKRPDDVPPTDGAPTATDEASKTREQARLQEQARLRAQRDRIAAGVIGRGLVSPDEAVRREAVDQLLTRLRESGPVEPFLRAMGDAVGNWANQQDRLMEVWLDQAVNGTAAERDRAVLLLTALGTKAVRRLTLELRHGARHGGLPADKTWRTGENADESAGAQEVDESESAPPTRPTEYAAGLPRRYDVADLIAQGWGRWELKSMLRREADAVSVHPHDDGYIVTALQKGHDALRTHLQRLRTKPSTTASEEKSVPPGPKAPSRDIPDRDTPGRGKPGPVPPDGSIETGAAEDGAKKPRATTPTRGEPTRDHEKSRPPPQSGQDDAAPVPDPAATVDTRVQSGAAGSKSRRSARAVPVPLNRAAPDWLISPEILHLPRGGMLAARLSAEAGAFHQRNPIEEKSDVVVGSLTDAKRWALQARRLPDARAALPLEGATALVAGGKTRLFAGREIRYSKDLERTKGGAWRIVSDTVPHGIELELVVTKEGERIQIQLKARRCDVGLPMRVVTVQPSESAAPVELEYPEWSTTSVSTSFLLPREGGGVFVPLHGLGSGADDHVVLVLGVEPYKVGAPQQAAVRGVR